MQSVMILVGATNVLLASQLPAFSVPQSVNFFAACKDFLGGFHQRFHRRTACGHQAGDDFTPLFGQHVAVGFEELFD